MNDETLNEFVVTVERWNIGETDAKNDKDCDREDRDKRDEEDGEEELQKTGNKDEKQKLSRFDSQISIKISTFAAA